MEPETNILARIYNILHIFQGDIIIWADFIYPSFFGSSLSISLIVL